MDMGFLSGAYMHFYTGDHPQKFGLIDEDISVTVLFIEAKSPDDLDEWVAAEEECEYIITTTIDDYMGDRKTNYKSGNGNCHKTLAERIRNAIDKDFSWEVLNVFVEFDEMH